jgi:hypothetical protein
MLMRFDSIAASVVRGQGSDREEWLLFRCESNCRSGELAGNRHLLSIYRKPRRAGLPYTSAMPNNIGRFAINADDVPRARDFYQKVFGWKFEPWGPPNFYLIETGAEQVRAVGGLLQERRELVPTAG